MKTYILQISVIIGLMVLFTVPINAYITVPSSSFSLKTGEEKYLAVPDAYDGYIDNTIWGCNSSDIQFKQKDCAGAIIQIARSFNGIAIVEVMATEKYVISGHTRARSYYKQYMISCVGGNSGSTTDPNGITLPTNITLTVGETKTYHILSSSNYILPFEYTWEKTTRKNFAWISANPTTGNISITGSLEGEGILNVVTNKGDKRQCKVTVTFPDITSNRRTEKVAIMDIKSLLATNLQLFETSDVKEIFSENNFNSNDINTLPPNIYNLNGTIIKEDASLDDLRDLTPGFYIYKGKKIIVR